MADLKPFRPLRYNPAVAGDLSRVIAPPYDVISNEYRDRLYARSEFNVVRLILNPSADRYGAAAAELRDWLQRGVLTRDAQPALCYYVENFALRDESKHERAGLISLVRLEPFSSGRIRPHERTFARHKEDRMKLLRATHTNLSPIFGLYANAPHALDPARDFAARQAPDIDVEDDAGERHRVWLIRQSNVIERICATLAPAEIVIADGHHRYETALAYRDQLRANGQTDPEAPHNFVMMYVTSMNHPGLVVLPTHRVLRGATALDAAGIIDRLRSQFRLTPFGATAGPEFQAAVRRTKGQFGVLLAGHPEPLLATVNQPEAVGRAMAPLAPSVRSLDVALLDTVILRGLLGIDCTAAAQDGHLIYTHDDEIAIASVANGAQAAFLMSPPLMEEMLAVCHAGETMPEKSTYFFPKLLSGLVFHPLGN